MSSKSAPSPLASSSRVHRADFLPLDKTSCDWSYYLSFTLTYIVVSSDGPSAKYHRKLTSPAFSEKNNHLVWQASLSETQQMMESFLGPSGKFQTVERIANNTQQLSLKVLGQAGLGEKLELSNHADSALSSSDGRSFSHSLDYVMKNVVRIMMVKQLPQWVQNIGKSGCHLFSAT